MVAEPLHDRLYRDDQIRKNAARDVLQHRLPGLAAGRIVALGCGVEAFAIGLGEARALGGLDPFTLLLESREGPGLRAEIRMGPRDEQPHEMAGIVSSQSKAERSAMSSKCAGDRGGFFLGRRRCRMKSANAAALS